MAEVAVVKDFILWDEMYRALDASEDPDPKTVIPGLAVAIMKRPRDEIRLILEQLLVHPVLNLNGRMRRSAGKDKSGGASGNGGRSKRDGIALLADQIRDRREVLGDGDWKHLRHLAIGDVQLIINAYANRAAANQLEEKRYTRLHNAMQTAKVATAGDLPDELLVELFR